MIEPKTQSILSEIRGRTDNTRDDIAFHYSALIANTYPGDGVNWTLINRAILTRWSESGLQYIKRRAWKYLERKGASS